MRDQLHSPWLQRARLPLAMIGALSALILAFNFTLDFLSLLDLQREHHFLLLLLLVCLAAWALLEDILLRRNLGKHERHLKSLQGLLILQLLVQCGRLVLFSVGGTAQVQEVYGLRVLETGQVFVFLPVYLFVFMLVGHALISSYIGEIESAYLRLKRSNRRLTTLATTDPLTGAFNRRHFENRVDAEVARAQRDGKPLSLMIFDIDHFKKVNDRFGHRVGDEVLVELTQLAQEHARDNDVLARWGGEEFIMLLPDCDALEAHQAAEKLRQTISNHHFDVVGQLTCSFGVAQALPGEPLQTWVNRADAALYGAKDTGRNAAHAV